MSGIGERVRLRRKELGLSTPQLAKRIGGISYQTLQQVESGGGTKHLVAIAAALGVTPEWLQYGRDGKLTPHDFTQPQMENQLAVASNGSVGSGRGERPEGAQTPRLQVLGMAETGPDGWSLWNGDVIDTVPMPANLAGVKGAYAVFIAGDSMAPRYRAGEVAHIHPHKPITIGAYVLIQKKPKGPGEAPLAVIKELVRRSGSKIVLAQYNPAKTFEIKTDEIVSMHRVVGSAEA